MTLSAFERIILHCIIYYNSQRIIEDFPFSKEMLAQRISPYSSSIWNWSKEQAGANLIPVSYDDLVLTLLPRTTGKFSRNGLKVNKLRYKNDAFTEHYLRGEAATVAYNPDDVSCVWMLENGIYTPFSLTESRFNGLNVTEVNAIKNAQKSHERSLSEDNLQAQIDLARHIEAVANASVRFDDTNIKQIRHTRKKEQSKAHIDFVKGGMKHG